MKSFACACALLLAAVSFAQAETPPPPAETTGRSFSLGAAISYWDLSRLEGLDVDGAGGGGIVGHFRQRGWWAFELRLSGYAVGDTRDVEAEDGRRFENDLTIVAMPLEANLLFCLPFGDVLSLYGGPGAGYYLFDGQSNSDLGDRHVIYDIEVDDEFGGYALVGLRAQLTPHFGLFAEGKYTWVETSIERTSAVWKDIGIDWGREELDFSGFAVNVGMSFTF